MDHRQLANDPSNAAQHQLHPIGFTRPDVTSLFAISTAQEYDVALVQSPPSLYAYLGGLWTLLSFTGTGVPVTDVITDGQPIITGVSLIHDIGADSTHQIVGTLLAGSVLKIAQKDAFVAVIQPPAGWNFSNMFPDEVKRIGQGSVLNLSFFGGTMIFVDSLSDPVQP